MQAWMRYTGATTSQLRMTGLIRVMVMRIWPGYRELVMPEKSSVAGLVARAALSDQAAWDEIVERYAPLVWSICTRYRLGSQDIEDIGQNVWLRLVEHIGTLREPAALPGWLATTTQRECLRVVRKHDRCVPLPDELPRGPDDLMVEQEIIMAERNIALRTALAELPG